jgi:predicted Rossmann fold flavoprotein
VRIIGTKLSQTGPLLITHWGLSGPAVIKLSAWGAEYLHSVNYDFTVLVSWIGVVKEEDIRQKLSEYKLAHPKQSILKNVLFNTIPSRLWLKLCELAEIPEEKVYGEMSNKQMNKILENLIRCPFQIRGKTTFKEEFVTCGGVSLDEIDLTTMESKKVKGLYFAGEVLNIDGVTGGFNFQAAWTTAWVVANSI